MASTEVSIGSDWLGLLVCLYSLVCMLLFDVWALLYPPPNRLSSEDLERLFGFFGFFGFRFDRLVSLAADLVFAAACLVHSGRKAGCVRNGVSQVPVLCNEFANMIGLTAYLLLAMDLLPVYRSPFGRIVPLARLGDWFSSSPLLASMVIALDHKLVPDTLCTLTYTLLLQVAPIALVTSSMTSDTYLSRLFQLSSLIPLPVVFYILREMQFKYKWMIQNTKSFAVNHPNYPLIQFSLSKTHKSINALTLFCILFTFMRSVQFSVRIYNTSYDMTLILFIIGNLLSDRTQGRVPSSYHRRLLDQSLTRLYGQFRSYSS